MANDVVRPDLVSTSATTMPVHAILVPSSAKVSLTFTLVNVIAPGSSACEALVLTDIRTKR